MHSTTTIHSGDIRATYSAIPSGARSYNYRNLDVDATHNVAAYAATGGEVNAGRVGVRLEVRDYVAGFKPLTGAGTASTRNDVVIMVACASGRAQNEESEWTVPAGLMALPGAVRCRNGSPRPRTAAA